MLLATQLPSESSDPRNDQPLEGVAFASDIDTLLVANSGDSNSLSLSLERMEAYTIRKLLHISLNCFSFLGKTCKEQWQDLGMISLFSQVPSEPEKGLGF